MCLHVGVLGLADLTEIKIDAIRTFVSNSTDGIRIAAIARDSSMNETL